MIKNDKQLSVTKKRIVEFKELLSKLEVEEMDDLLKKVHSNAINLQIKVLEKEINDYEELKSTQVNVIYANSISEFPALLIKSRIAKGLTHAELAAILDLKEQQIQRYEQTDYSTASFERINQVAEALQIKTAPLKVNLNNNILDVPEGYSKEQIDRAINMMQSKRSLLNLSQ